MADGGVSAAEQQLYLQFFKHLGITDDNQMTGFLASLLRNVFDACSKLDMHLVPYSATVHSAVSRMIVPNNPRDAPSYRWIRVVDRVGFFSDDDAHAVRIVNIGLSYAYRFLGADAISVANAALLDKTQQSANRLPAVVCHGGGATAARVESAGLGNIPPLVDAVPPSGVEKALPPGGAVVSIGGVAVAGGCAAGPIPSDLQGDAPGARGSASTGQGAASPAGNSAEQPFPAGGIVVSRASRADAGETDAALVDAVHDALLDPLGDPLAGLEDAVEEEDGADANEEAPSHVVYERQPHVVPSTTAVDAVSAVLRTVGQRNDSAGKDVLRKLLTDSLLCLVRTDPGSGVTGGAAAWTTGSGKDWLAVNKLTGRWWPMWKAPDNLGSVTPPSGTVASVVNRTRAARSSRWIVLLDMSEIKKPVEELSVRSSRFFPKSELPKEEPVVRVHYRKPLRLTLVVASMLLMCTKEERFPAILTSLAAAGRSAVQKSSNLSAAARHEFFSSGVGLSTAPQPSSGPAASASPSSVRPGGTFDELGATPGEACPDLDQQMRRMQATLADEGVRESAINHFKRLEMIRLRSAARLSTAARPPTGSSGTTSAATAGSTPLRNAASPPSLQPCSPARLPLHVQPLPGAVVVVGPSAAGERDVVAAASGQPEQRDETGAPGRGTKRVRSPSPPPRRAISTAPPSGSTTLVGAVPGRRLPAPPPRRPGPGHSGRQVAPAEGDAAVGEGLLLPVAGERGAVAAVDPNATGAAVAPMDDGRPPGLESLAGASVFTPNTLGGARTGGAGASSAMSPLAPSTLLEHQPPLAAPLPSLDEDTPLSTIYGRESNFSVRHRMQNERTQRDMTAAQASLSSILSVLHPTKANGSKK